MEGALKLKEISYIHAEGYAAGELKHGPIALVDENMPVIVIAPHDDLYDKTISNMEEVAARGGKIVLLTDDESSGHKTFHRIRVPKATPSLARCFMRCRCNCWPIMPPSSSAPMLTSRAIWQNR